MHQLLFLILTWLAFSAQAQAQTQNSAFGLASDYHVVRTEETALTGIFFVGASGMVQPYFVVVSSDPTLFGMGGSYKHTVSGDSSDGLHVGGGMGFGTFAKDKNFVHFNGIAGFHFSIAKHILIHIDGGLTVGTADSKNQLYIGGHSSIFGLSALYRM
jgi:hypothetical protein